MPRNIRRRMDNKDGPPEKAVVAEIPPARLIMNISNALFTVLPSLEKKLDRRRVARMLTMMCSSGMLGIQSNPYMRDTPSRIEYAKYMIQYDADVRSIARFVGLPMGAAVDFIQCCFSTNRNIDGLYPYSPWGVKVWPCYEQLIIKYGESIAECIIGFITGEMTTSLIVDHFGMLNAIAKNMVHASSAVFFILEGCRFVAEHEDRKRAMAHGQSRSIFIDEFIDYLREMDKVRYEKFQDEISDQLSEISTPFTPDCSIIINHMNMAKFDDNVSHVHTCFKTFLDVPESEPEPELEPESIGNSIGESKAYFSSAVVAIVQAEIDAFDVANRNQLRQFPANFALSFSQQPISLPTPRPVKLESKQGSEDDESDNFTPRDDSEQGD